MNEFWHEYFALLHDWPHYAFELTLMIVFDGIALGLIWPWLKKVVRRQVVEHEETHGISHKDSTIADGKAAMKELFDEYGEPKLSADKKRWVDDVLVTMKVSKKYCTCNDLACVNLECYTDDEDLSHNEPKKDNINWGYDPQGTGYGVVSPKGNGSAPSSPPIGEAAVSKDPTTGKR